MGGKVCRADDFGAPGLERRDYGFGWQYFKPSSGLSLKIPLHANYYLQPVFAFSEKESDQGLQQHSALGIRGLYDFPARYDLMPYAGVAIGHSGSTAGGSAGGTSGGTGYQIFFGVEYQKYLLRPALEMGMGGYWNSQGNFEAGLVFNFSLMYYF